MMSRVIKEITVSAPMSVDPHPNEFDLKRITRMLEHRVRYRYVTPVVQPIEEGYLVVSPCCSRNIDDSGGIIDIARIKYDHPNDHGKNAKPDNETNHDRSLTPVPPLPEGEGYGSALRKYHSNEKWRLYRKDHQLDVWVLHSTAATLHELIAELNEDPARVFWQ